MAFSKGRSGNPAGRPNGAKDKHPRSARRVIQELLEQFGANTDLLAKVLQRGLEAKPPTSFPYFKLLTEQQLGAPEQTVNAITKVVHEHRES